jgi:hypothetical protein
MQFLLIMVITIVLDFLTHSFSKQLSNKIDDKRYIRVHIHHSVWGVLVLVLGIIIGNQVVMAIGAGVYIGHVMEEMYFNKRNLVTAIFIFVTR